MNVYFGPYFGEKNRHKGLCLIMSFLPALCALKEAFAADLIDEDEFRQHKAKLLDI